MPVDFNRPIYEWLPTRTYAGFRPDLPDLVLGRLPEPVSIAVGRAFKGWIIESAAERAALEAALAQPIPQPEPGRLNFKAGPDASCAARSVGPAFLALYASPEEGWPLQLLSSFAPERERRTRIQRDRYVWETFATPAQAEEALAAARAEAGEVPVYRGP